MKLNKIIGFVSLIWILSAASAPAGDLQVFPGFVNFGQVQVGMIQSETVTVQNMTDKEIHSIMVSPEGYDFDFTIQSSGCGFLLPHGNCSIWLTYHPSVVGLSNLTIEVSDGSDMEQIDVSGEGTQRP